MSEILVSICIPTYNRAEILDKTLASLVLETSFLVGQIEICISDNASLDNTEEVVQKYAAKYKNIIYHRNQVNTGIIDDNFPIAGSLASGTFIKFLNDYAYFISGELDHLIQFIESNKTEKPILFFPNNNIRDKTSIIYCDSLDSFVQKSSFWTTWIFTAGFWREDFLSIIDRDRYAKKFMWCPDNYLRLVNSGRKVIIYNVKICKFHTLKHKGGYNMYEIFIDNYLELYDYYLKSGNLSPRIFHKEKICLYKNYLIPTTINYLTSKNTIYSFELKGAAKKLFQNYWYYPYFYLGIIKFAILYTLSKYFYPLETIKIKLKLISPS